MNGGRRVQLYTEWNPNAGLQTCSDVVPARTVSLNRQVYSACRLRLLTVCRQVFSLACLRDNLPVDGATADDLAEDNPYAGVYYLLCSAVAEFESVCRPPDTRPVTAQALAVKEKESASG